MKESNLEENMEYLKQDIDILVNNIINLPKITATAIIVNKRPLLLKLYKILSDFEKVFKENEELKEKLMEKDLEVIGVEEYTKDSMGEIIEQYYTANEKCIPTQKVEDKIEELKKEYEIELEENGTKAFILKCQIEILKELLEDIK